MQGLGIFTALGLLDKDVFCVFSNCFSSKSIDFSEGIFLSVPCLFSNIGMCMDVTRPDKYLLSTGYFIIVRTQLFLPFYVVINKKNLNIYL